MGRRYRRRSHGSAIVSDSVYIAARLPWWAAICFGFISFLIFYFGFPAFLESKASELSGSAVSQAFESIFTRRIHWFEWLGIACGLIGIFFGIRNYLVSSYAGYEERGLVAFLAKIISRNVN
ncbi:hypothetical protein ACCH70_004234 [Vibrio vulnificus]|uniref:hypothetical protein n=1 Tax=Vibrio TaxID=662 RepID=UPI0005F12CA4|nr:MULTISPECIES: hypothetical protein [Vibrio]EGQ7854809.1 hypothetical protein [Vibrio vulnificus]EGQ8075564.1 hypothetical protein [Vibrio vulnificus]EGR2424274.1 hypothetical protein [Vibrio cholerae]EHG1331851.1 hypothetical protein [Vibrio vulnificus]EHH0684937.1 hypothetical protein [Vibrio vulnificus]